MAIVPPSARGMPVSPPFPAESLARSVGRMRDPAILESGPGFGDSGRRSVFAASPRIVFEATGSAWGIRQSGADGSAIVESGDSGPLDALARWLDRLGLGRSAASPPPLPRNGGEGVSLSDPSPPFTGGLIGFFGYDLAPQIERLPRRSPADSRIPDVRFALYDRCLTLDHLTGEVQFWSNDFLGDGEADRRRRDQEFLDSALRADPEIPSPSRLGPVRPDVPRDRYLEAVRRCLEYIAAGDIFQVNLSQRFTAPGKADPLDLYERLKRRSPAPFSAFLRGDDLALVSASPEWFYQARGGLLVTRPIKGTRPRGPSPEEDARLAAELRSSVKDRAELTMIVDLERNDLGRVCQFGSVKVTEPLVVESFAQVHHLVATIEGRLRPEIGPIDVVRAMFPGGSITGAPKIRAMEIIDELEPSRRGVYTGAIGYFGAGGTSAFNIAIRTILVEGDRVSYQVGGGIVADSVAELEYEETLHKGRGLRDVIEGWRGEP